MTLHCSLVRIYNGNVLNCNFPNRPLFLLSLKCTCPSFCPATFSLQSFTPLTWQTPTCSLNSVILRCVPCFPETQSGAFMFSPRQPILIYISKLMPFFHNCLFTCLTGLLNELNLALLSPPNAVKHWQISFLPGNILRDSSLFYNIFRY